VLPSVPTKPERRAESPPTPSGCSVSDHKSDVVRKIEAMDAKRVERRRRAAEAKCRREDDTTAAKAAGMGIECVDFLRLLAAYRGANGLGGEPEPCTFGTDLWASEGGSAAIRVCVRKRPMLKLERIGHDFDVVDLVPREATGSACSVALVPLVCVALPCGKLREGEGGTSDCGATEASTAGAAAGGGAPAGAAAGGGAIGGGAIGCSGLTSVTIPDSVVAIGDGGLGNSAAGGGVAPPASLWTYRRVLTLTSTLAGSGDCD